MEKVYHPKDIESKWYQIWEQGGYFKPNDPNDIANYTTNKSNSNYCIMIPPPNVTGSLHMGHAFQDTIMDALIRYHRMRGYVTLWQVGTDHAGIATQMVVERQLQQENQTRLSLGREKFIEKIWQWKQQSGQTITNQLRRLGASVDWSTERFTMDAGFSKAVQTIFIQLYKESLIYRGKRLVNWDPILHTAISDLEVTAEEENGNLWYINYPIENSNESLIVATTRPETMFGDMAVAVHPEDERYKHLIGKKINLPLCNREIPIIADNYVDPSFATGCVKITPAHDFNDYEIAKRHNLDQLNIFTKDAKINKNAPYAYQGLDRFVAREKVITDLKQANLLHKVENHILKVPRGDRTNAIIEPYLTDQWFVKIEPLAKPAIEAVECGAIEFIPNNWSKTYFDWMNNIQDWCISRQLWWGHRIPAWYDKSGNIYVGYSEEEIRSEYKLSSDIILVQDEDVLDTWFSSALWPFATLGWPNSTASFDKFYPTDVLVTGFDIIFFWVARMIMFGLKFTDYVPFKKVYIHGLIQDHDGQKMSKSKGNIVDPIDLIDGINLENLIKKRTSGLMQPQLANKIEITTRKQFPNGISSYGTDALRFTFLSLATTGRHIRFDIARLDGNRNFCNKLWNAARYVFMNIENYSINNNIDNNNKILTIADRWILSRWQITKKNIINYFEKYRFDLAVKEIYEFTWNEYCDWYLELSKPILTAKLNNCDQLTVNGTRWTLVNILAEVLQVLHPMMPFITEEIWEKLRPLLNDDKILIEHSYPIVELDYLDETAEQTIAWIKAFIIGVRNIRGEMNIAPSKLLPVLLTNYNHNDQLLLSKHDEFIKSLAKLDTINLLKNNEQRPLSATTLVGEMEVLVPMQNLIDKDAEISRLNKEMEKLKQELEQSQARLANPNYIAKAPHAVVSREQHKVLEIQTAINKLTDSLEHLKSS